MELALLPCWRFLIDQPIDSLQRLVMMTRGLADPLACSYCHLYVAHCAEKLPSFDSGIIIYFLLCHRKKGVQHKKLVMEMENCGCHLSFLSEFDKHTFRKISKSHALWYFIFNFLCKCKFIMILLKCWKNLFLGTISMQAFFY